ncbi:hypothetical protein M3Y98_00784900 [Aphelenchoides besseyi]|nr:hypothetical protein M3Y98_00784900 [Aphelenchoides besseyi]
MIHDGVTGQIVCTSRLDTMPWLVGKKKDQPVDQHSPMPNNEDKKLNLQKLQDRLKDIHGKLNRTARGSDRYLYSDKQRTLCNQTAVEVDGRIRAGQDYKMKIAVLNHVVPLNAKYSIKFINIDKQLIG